MMLRTHNETALPRGAGLTFLLLAGCLVLVPELAFAQSTKVRRGEEPLKLAGTN